MSGNNHNPPYSDKILSHPTDFASPEKEAVLRSHVFRAEEVGLEPHHPDLPICVAGELDGVGHPAGQRKSRLSRKCLCWTLAALTVIAIVAAVVGGVLGTRRHGHSPPPPTSSTGPSPANSTSPSPSPVYTNIRNDTNLAAVAFNDSSSTMQYRVYFQDSDNFIKESSWNATNQKWYVSNTNITRAKAASPIAAATVGPGDMNSSSPAGIYQSATKLQYINIYFLDDTNTINELYTTSQDFNSWSPGTLTSQKYVAVETSALTALWHSASTCVGCSNSLLLAYQDQSSQARLINGTQDGWSSYALTMNPITQSGLSLVKMLDINGWINSLRLYYQIEAGNMASHDWFSPAQIPYLESKWCSPRDDLLAADQRLKQYRLANLMRLTAMAGKIAKQSL